MRTHKNRSRAAAAPVAGAGPASRRLIGLLVGLLAAAGCAGGESAKDGSAARAVDGAGALDLGDDWMQTGSARGTRSSSVPISTGPASAWSIVLLTFTDAGHEGAARNAARNCARIDERLADVGVHTTSKGSMIVYGRYEGPEDPAAATALEWIKGLERSGRTVFPRAILTRVRAETDPRAVRPIDLLSLRARHPGVNPLYTLQVGVWGDFESGVLERDERRRRADARVRALRGQGHEAYVHHDDDRGLSMVTVGAFDRTAFDAQSGIAAPELERLMRTFPEHLVNGERLLEPIDPRRPTLGTRVQKPRLVLVPGG